MLVRERIDVERDPWEAALALRGDRAPVALVGAWFGGGALLASEPVRVAGPREDPFALLAEAPPGASGASGGAVGGGWFGWLGYGLGARVEPVPPGPPRPVARPPFVLAFYDHVLRQDAAGRWWWEALWSEERAAALEARRRELEARLRREPAPRPFAVGTFAAAAPGWAGHEAAVAACRQRIRAGEIFQANVCLRLEADWDGDPLDAFARAGGALRPPRAAFVGDGEGAVVSLSPELFLARRGLEVVSEPIKGTAPAGSAELAQGAKERAENVMIVDLMRNDLGRVAQYGAVRVDAVAAPTSFPGLEHLVSRVRATLRPGTGHDALLRATFPPGSVTGAPKVQALRVIAELEGTGREAYTGAVGGAAAASGDLELNVAIRTLEVAGGRAWLGVGGGIVADSEPAEEAAECRVKAAPVLAALGSSLATPEAALPGPPPGVPWALDLVPAERPDPRAGVFTTVGLRDGAPVGLDRHIARLEASTRELFGAALPAGLGEEAGRRAHGAGPGSRLRIDAVPDAETGQIRVSVAVGAVRRDGPALLRAVVLPGGLGRHKWRDRRLLDALGERLGAVPLLLDADGCVLEAGPAAVLLREGARHVAPPPDRGRLPSTALAAFAAREEVRFEPFGLARAREADAVLLLNATASEPWPVALAG